MTIYACLICRNEFGTAKECLAHIDGRHRRWISSYNCDAASFGGRAQPDEDFVEERNA